MYTENRARSMSVMIRMCSLVRDGSLVSNEGVSLIPAVAILRSDQVFAWGKI